MPRIPDPAPAPAGIRTVADFLHWLGDVPADRILLRPAPGMGNASDVLRLERQENRLCELVCGVAVEKRLGYKEMSVAAVLMGALQVHAEAKQIGVVTGPEGFYRLSEHLVRIPSVAFCAAGTFRGDIPPGEAAAGTVPQFVAEIIEGPATTELQQRIEDYFAAGVKLVWVIDLSSRTATAYTSPKKLKSIPARGTLEGGRLLGGFKIQLAKLFDHFGKRKK
jgi:Putative restriction endonuclease